MQPFPCDMNKAQVLEALSQLPETFSPEELLAAIREHEMIVAAEQQVALPN